MALEAGQDGIAEALRDLAAWIEHIQNQGLYSVTPNQEAERRITESLRDLRNSNISVLTDLTYDDTRFREQIRDIDLVQMPDNINPGELESFRNQIIAALNATIINQGIPPSLLRPDPD